MKHALVRVSIRDLTESIDSLDGFSQVGSEEKSGKSENEWIHLVWFHISFELKNQKAIGKIWNNIFTRYVQATVLTRTEMYHGNVTLTGEKMSAVAEFELQSTMDGRGASCGMVLLNSVYVRYLQEYWSEKVCKKMDR